MARPSRSSLLYVPLSICLLYKAGDRPHRSLHFSRIMLTTQPVCSPGLHAMGSYDSYGLFFRHYLPLWHGPGCMLLPFFLPASNSPPPPLHPTNTIVSAVLDRSLSLARPRPNRRNHHRRPSLLPRPRAPWPPIRQKRPRLLRKLAHAHPSRASRAGRVSQTAPRESRPGPHPLDLRPSPRHPGQDHARDCLGPDALRRHRGAGLLPG